MFSGVFTSVTPVVDAKEEPPAIRLLDVSLIVVGEGAAAAELVRRRRLEGGRVCWLETVRPPLSFEGPEYVTELADPTNSRSAFWTSCAKSHLDVGIHWDLSGFHWEPPSWRRQRRQGSGGGGDAVDIRTSWGSSRSITKDCVVRNQRQWGSASYAWRTSGPEIVDLQEDESYNVILGDDDRAPGIQVMHSDGSLNWQMSGVVVFAGVFFHSLKGLAEVVEMEEAARQLDVGVNNEEAKPFSIVRPQHVLAWAGVMFVQSLIFFVLMGIYEPHLKPESTPWWRASFSMLIMVPFGLSSVPDVMGPVLTGGFVDWRLRAVMGIIDTVGHTLVSVTPIGWIGDRYYTLPLFGGVCVAFMWYLAMTMPLHILFSKRRDAPQVEREERRMRWCAQVGWLMWILTGTFGSWVLLYGVALLFTYLELHWRILAMAALPLMTSGVELLAVCGTIQAYTSLVLNTRLKKWAFTVFGDQREAVIFPIGITHSCAEATRLVSVLVSAVKSPGLDWIPALLLGFALNIMQRTTISTKLLVSLVPSRWWWLVAPDAGTVLHNEVRLCLGYPRFVPIVALAVANLILHGFASWPLYNVHATLLVPVAALLEILEDVVVTSGFLQSDSWKGKMAPLYRSFDPLHPGLVMGFDKDGAHPSGPALSFSGMRYLRFRSLVVIMAPACFFAYNVLVLLLGAGFVHGVCDTWIADRNRLIDGLVWWTPLRCTEHY